MKHLPRIIVYSLLAILVLIFINEFLTQGALWKVSRSSAKKEVEPKGMKPIAMDPAFSLFQNRSAVFLDIRTSDEFAESHIPGALSIPYSDFIEHPLQLSTEDRDGLYIVYGAEEKLHRPRIIAQLLYRADFKHVYVLEGGFAEWLYQELPVEQEGELQPE
jgi:phage shock protein E